MAINEIIVLAITAAATAAAIAAGQLGRRREIQSEDIGAFIVSQVTTFGGHVKSATIPKVEGQWTVNQDANGFQASGTGASFTEIAAELEQVFGPPRKSDDGSVPRRYWASTDIAVGILLIGSKDATKIMCRTLESFR